MDKHLYTRPNKPTRLHVNQRDGAPSPALQAPPEPLMLDRSTECHVTPAAAAGRIVDWLEPTPDQLTLEPSCGTGSLIAALLDSGHSAQKIVTVERSIALCGAIGKRFRSAGLPEPVCDCFLEYTARMKGAVEFPRIVMNPPFRKTKQHVAAALSLLGRAGHQSAILVALVPITFEHSGAELIETLPNDTFVTAKVNTKIIRFVQ